MIRILKRAHKFVKKKGLNIPVGPLSFFFLRKVVRTGLTDILTAELKKGSNFVDVGANIGYYTILASRLVGRHGQVHAFEPDPINYKRLARYVKANKCKNVVMVQAAISNKKGEIKLFLSDDNASDHRTYEVPGRNSLTMKAIDLNTYCKDRKVDFIKIDVQGFEQSVIDGMTDVLRANKEIKVITEFWPSAIKKAGANPRVYLESFSNLGFNFYLVRERKSTANQIGIEEIFRMCSIDGQVDLLCKR